jgi:hypothetical protein
MIKDSGSNSSRLTSPLTNWLRMAVLGQEKEAHYSSDLHPRGWDRDRPAESRKNFSSRHFVHWRWLLCHRNGRIISEAFALQWELETACQLSGCRKIWARGLRSAFGLFPSCSLQTQARIWPRAMRDMPTGDQAITESCGSWRNLLRWRDMLAIISSIMYKIDIDRG